MTITRINPSAPVTGVKGNAESSYRKGDVNITPANVGALPLTGGTLTGALTIGPNNIIYSKRNDYTASTVPSSNIWGTAIEFRDNSNVDRGHLRQTAFTSGDQGIQFEAKRKVNDTDYYNGLRLDIGSDGTRKVVVSEAAAWRSGIGAAATSHTHTLSQVTNALSIVKVVRKHATAVSVAANTTTNIYVSANDQTGYKLIGVVGATTNHADCMLVAAEIDPTNTSRVYAAVRNITSSAKSCSPYFDVLYLRTS